MEFSIPNQQSDDILGQFSSKWFNFVKQFKCHQDPNTSFLLYYGAETLKELKNSNKISTEEFPRFIACLEALEARCLFQIVLCFLRHLFFNHCQPTGSTVKEFFTELNLLSECCSFDNNVRDDLIKSQLISNIPDKPARDKLVSANILTARDVVDVCSMAEKQGSVVNMDLINIFILEQQKKIFHNPLMKTKPDNIMPSTSVQEIQVEMNQGCIFRNDIKCASANDTALDTTRILPDLTPKHKNNDFYPSFNCSNTDQIISDSSMFANDKDTTITYPPQTIEVNLSSLFEPLANYSIPFQELQLPQPVVAANKKEPETSNHENNLNKHVVKTCTDSKSNNLTLTSSDNDNDNDNDNLENTNAALSSGDANYDLQMCILDPNDDSSCITRKEGEETPLLNSTSGDASQKDVPLLNFTSGDSSQRDNVPLLNSASGDASQKDNVPLFNSISGNVSQKEDVSEIPAVFISQQKAILKTGQIVRAMGQAIDVYTCNFCVFNCPGKAAIEEHALQDHKSLKCFVCTACNSKFPIKEQIDSHVRVKHLNVEEHKCEICDLVFTSQKRLFVHLQGHADTRMESCEVCRAMFKTSKLLYDHMCKAHPYVPPWVCQICDATFSRRKSLSEHVSEAHSPKEKVNNRMLTPIPKVVMGHKTFYCKLCDISFKDKVSSHNHKKKFHQKIRRNHPCSYCDHICSSNSNLIVHLRVHTGEKPYQCEICGKEFAQPSSLDKHTMTHTGEKPFKCQYCDAAFTASSNRLVHERRHRNERPYICEQCGKTYRNSYELKLHIETHNEFRVKRHVCDCGAAFDTRRKMKRHELTHSGMKPHKCEICGAEFTRPENVKAHQNSKACRNRVLKLQ